MVGSFVTGCRFPIARLLMSVGFLRGDLIILLARRFLFRTVPVVAGSGTIWSTRLGGFVAIFGRLVLVGMVLRGVVVFLL
jgi:hypothetical protein